jgi:hypothetical protein
MKIIRIVQCKDSLLWYNTQLETRWVALREEPDVYWVRASDGYLNIVYKSDAVVELVERKGLE